MAGETERPDESTEPTASEQEALEQAELRRIAAEKVAEGRSHRAEGVPEEPDEEELHGEWKPPPELKDTTNRRILFRFVVFLVVVFGGYYGLRWATFTLFSPDIRAVAPVLPEGELTPGQTVTVGATLHNRSMMDGAGFVVAVLSDGQEFEGETVDVPGRDTAFASVEIPLDIGVNVFSIVAFDGWREIERLTSFPGLALLAGERQLELELLDTPRHLARGDTVTIEFKGTNHGQVVETLVPLVRLEPEEGGASTDFRGILVELGPGESLDLRTLVDTSALDPGTYFVAVLAVTPQGEIMGRGRYPVPLDVTE